MYTDWSKISTCLNKSAETQITCFWTHLTIRFKLRKTGANGEPKWRRIWRSSKNCKKIAFHANQKFFSQKCTGWNVDWDGKMDKLNITGTLKQVHLTNIQLNERDSINNSNESDFVSIIYSTQFSVEVLFSPLLALSTSRTLLAAGSLSKGHLNDCLVIVPFPLRTFATKNLPRTDFFKTLTAGRKW